MDLGKIYEMIFHINKCQEYLMKRWCEEEEEEEEAKL